MRTSLLFIIVSLLFISCEGKKPRHNITTQLMSAEQLVHQQDSSIVTINHEEHLLIPYKSMNTKIKYVRYIPFFSEEPIGEIEQVIVHNDRVILLDAYNEEKINFFDLSGRLIKTIDSKGSGPEEYVGLSYMFISSNGDQIIALDGITANLLYYSMDGQFLRKTRTVPSVLCESFHDENVNYTVYGQSFSRELEENYTLTISKRDSIVRKGFPFYPIQVGACNGKAFHYNHFGELIYKPVLSDTIYTLSSDSTYSIKYVVNHKKSIWKKSAESLTWDQVCAMVKQSGWTYLGNSILETADYVYYNINSGAGDHVISQPYWYDKKRKQSFSFSSKKDEDKCVLQALPKPETIYKNHFVGVFQEYEVQNMINKIENKGFIYDNKELNEILHAKNRQDIELILVMYEFN